MCQVPRMTLLADLRKKDGIEEAMPSQVRRSSSTTKASRILGETEETVTRQQAYLPLHRRYREAFPDFGSPSPRNNSFWVSTSAHFRKRTCSAPASSSTRTSLAGDDIQPLDARRSTVANIRSVAVEPESFRLSLRLHRPEGRGDDPVLRPIYELAIHKARSVRKKFQ